MLSIAVPTHGSTASHDPMLSPCCRVGRHHGWLFVCWALNQNMSENRVMDNRSSMMSLTTFISCSFVLILRLRDYQYFFYLDMMFSHLVMVYFN